MSLKGLGLTKHFIIDLMKKEKKIELHNYFGPVDKNVKAETPVDTRY